MNNLQRAFWKGYIKQAFDSDGEDMLPDGSYMYGRYWTNRDKQTAYDALETFKKQYANSDKIPLDYEFCTKNKYDEPDLKGQLVMHKLKSIIDNLPSDYIPSGSISGQGLIPTQEYKSVLDEIKYNEDLAKRLGYKYDDKLENPPHGLSKLFLSNQINKYKQVKEQYNTQYKHDASDKFYFGD